MTHDAEKVDVATSGMDQTTPSPTERAISDNQHEHSKNNTVMNPQHQQQNSTSSSSESSPPLEPTSEDATTATKDGSASPPDEKQALDRQTSRADEFGKWRITVIMFSLCMALFLAALDVTIITTALPTIAQHFGASSSGYTWIGSGYLLASAAATPLWGKFSDIFGRKPVIVMANVVFLVGSLICAQAVSIGMLVGGRVVQGLGGGGLVILVNICISDLFSMRDRPKYYGFVGVTWAVASGVGPVIGGVFTQEVSWRWCFYINLPLDGLSLILLIFFLKLETPKTPFMNGIKAIDWVGGLAIVGGVVCFLYGMESGGVMHPWNSAFVLCLIIFGIVLVGIFFVIEWKIAKYPIMPLRLFKDHSNIAAYMVCFLHGFVFIAHSYYLPIYFQTVLSLSPILSGCLLFALVIPLSAASAVAGVAMKRTGRYQEFIWGAGILLCLGTGLFIDLPPYRGWAKIIIYQIIAGIGVGPLFQGPLIALQSHLKGYDAAVGTATYGFIRNISTAVSVVLGGVIFQNEISNKRGELAQALGPELVGRFSGTSFGSVAGLVGQLSREQKQAIDRVYTSSLRTMWIFYTAFAALLIVISFFITKKELSKEREVTKTGIEEQERIRQEQKALKRQSKLANGQVGKDIETASPVEGENRQ